MQKRSHTRRGVALIVVLTIIVLVGGMLTVLAAGATGLYRNRKIQQVEQVSRSVADSATAYVRRHLPAWSDHPPERDIPLNIAAILPEGMTGTCVLSFPTVDHQRCCRVTAHVKQNTQGKIETLDLPLKPPDPAATSSASNPG